MKQGKKLKKCNFKCAFDFEYDFSNLLQLFNIKFFILVVFTIYIVSGNKVNFAEIITLLGKVK